ncbi:hypothetical protein AOB57_005445 [Methanosarcina flavescens]|uniref:Uncharacterized protein n=1 Tax=Methanosarcina flavescens TaxID=1715806 RepID=A0A660HQY9_9EURY|nr:hypothetical protein AOB57_005445 [Methanosarcina flavescens]
MLLISLDEQVNTSEKFNNFLTGEVFLMLREISVLEKLKFPEIPSVFGKVWRNKFTGKIGLQ